MPSFKVEHEARRRFHALSEQNKSSRYTVMSHIFFCCKYDVMVPWRCNLRPQTCTTRPASGSLSWHAQQAGMKGRRFSLEGCRILWIAIRKMKLLYIREKNLSYRRIMRQIVWRSKGKVYRVLKCDVIILQTFPFEPLNLIMRYTQLL